MTRPRRRIAAALAGLCLVAVVAACGVVQVRFPDGSTRYQSHEEFAVYVEAVFRYHNRVVNDLIVAGSLLGDEAVTENAALVRAEALMAMHCQPLNDVVAARIEGREIGFFRKLQLPQAVPACAQASRRLEQLLALI